MLAKTLISIALLAAACSSQAAPQSPATPVATDAPPTTPEPTAKPALPAQLASFDYVWDRIKETHWDTDVVGASWDRARSELRPKVIAAKTDDEARTIIRELIASLGQSHFGLVSSSPSPASVGGPATIGVDLRIVGQDVVIVRTEKDSPAQSAGLTPGAVIRAVDGKSIAELLASAPAGDHAKAALAISTLSTVLSGADGSSVALKIEDGKGERDVSLVRKIRAVPTASIGNVRIPVEYESRWLSAKKQVGYVRLTTFADPVRISASFKADIARFAKAKGIVLDLRGNPGGLGGMAMGMAGLLTDKIGKLGTMIQRESRFDFVVNPQPGAYLGNVAILVDSMCGSTCEILAAGLVDLGRAKTFGTTTMGAALPSLFEVLPSGDILQFAVANYVLPDGVALEGDGHKPSVVLERSPESLRAGRDAQLDGALQWIKTGKLR